MSICCILPCQLVRSTGARCCSSVFSSLCCRNWWCQEPWHEPVCHQPATSEGRVRPHRRLQSLWWSRRRTLWVRLFFSSRFSFIKNEATGYARQHIWCLSQARINWEGCSRNGTRRRSGELILCQNRPNIIWKQFVHCVCLRTVQHIRYLMCCSGRLTC